MKTVNFILCIAGVENLVVRSIKTQTKKELMCFLTKAFLMQQLTNYSKFDIVYLRMVTAQCH